MSIYSINEQPIHVLPVDDVGLHANSGVHCNCNPKVESFDGFFLVIHNSFDGRELFSEEQSVVDPLLIKQ